LQVEVETAIGLKQAVAPEPCRCTPTRSSPRITPPLLGQVLGEADGVPGSMKTGSSDFPF